MSKIILQCVKQGSKLRIRFHSFINEEGKEYTNVYSNAYNCQFPRAIRKEGCYYEVGAHDISLVDRGSSQAFYSVKAANIRVLNEAPKKFDAVDSLVDLKTFAVVECVICMGAVPDQVFLPCGHICTCTGCYEDFKHQSRAPVCPLCRRAVTSAILSAVLTKHKEDKEIEKQGKVEKTETSEVEEEEAKTVKTASKKRKNSKTTDEQVAETTTTTSKTKKAKKEKVPAVESVEAGDAKATTTKAKRTKKEKAVVAEENVEVAETKTKPKKLTKKEKVAAEEATLAEATVEEAKPKKGRKAKEDTKKAVVSEVEAVVAERASKRPLRQTKKTSA
jgi:hypothetical protein